MTALGDLAAAAVAIGAILKHFAAPKRKPPKR